MKPGKSNLKAHLFICTNRREPGGRPSCGERGSDELRNKLKKIMKDKGYGTQCRINSSGCLDRCEQGITAVLYPKNEWFLEIEKDSEESLQILIQKLETEIKKP